MPAAWREGSTLLTVPQGGRPGTFAVTFVQCAPASRVTCSRPSAVPAQITPFSSGDSAMAKTTHASSTIRLSTTSPPEDCCLLLSLVDRSGLITVQLWPPSVVRCTYWLPT